MITVELDRKFKKAFEKRIKFNPTLVSRTNKRIDIFRQNPFHPMLRNHPLIGGQNGLRAFSITGDIRIIYQPIDETNVRFLDIGTHNQVY